jgi:hypothetical protein
MVEMEEIHHALRGTADIFRLKQQANAMCSVPAWQHFMGTWQSQGTTEQVSAFDKESQDA